MVVLDENCVQVLGAQKITAVGFRKEAAMIPVLGRQNHENIFNFKTLDLHYAPAQNSSGKRQLALYAAEYSPSH
jgi:hypothetical protein